MNCTDCGVAMMSHHAWRNLTLGERAQHRARGVNSHVGHGMCSPCRQRFLRPDRTTRSVANVAEDWATLADRRLTQSANVRHLAPRLGMTETALERSILRAKKLGLVAA